MDESKNQGKVLSMKKVSTYLDCGCALMEDGSRQWCPTCTDNKTKAVKRLDCGCSILADGSRAWCPSCAQVSPSLIAENNKPVNVRFKIEDWSDGERKLTLVELSKGGQSVRFHCLDETNSDKFYFGMIDLIKKHTIEKLA